jgi:tRNA modification GTPase
MAGYELSDTVVAPATALAQSAIGVVRLSGAQAWLIARELLDSLPEQPQAQRAYVCALGPLDDGAGGRITERAVAVLWKGPHSYTGEDLVELSIHGSPVLLRLVVARCVERGARYAEPGEFTYRAYVNGKLDLVQAEAVQEVITSASQRALGLASTALWGGVNRRVRDWVDRITAWLAGIEVIHDYAADDLDATLDPSSLLTHDGLRAGIAELLGEMRSALDDSRRVAPLREGIAVAICGPPNVGKSTLFNALLGFDRAITAPEPGTTRDYLVESLDVQGIKLSLVDTAGIRDAPGALETPGVHHAGEWARAADQVLWVTAADLPPAPPPAGVGQVMQVVTRCDLLAKWPEPSIGIHFVSGLTGQGLAELRAALGAIASSVGEGIAEAFNVRQAQAVGEAVDALAQCLAAAERGAPFDMLAADLYEARTRLHGVYEQADRSMVIDQVFSRFCVGK